MVFSGIRKEARVSDLFIPTPHPAGQPGRTGAGKGAVGPGGDSVSVQMGSPMTGGRLLA